MNGSASKSSTSVGHVICIESDYVLSLNADIVKMFGLTDWDLVLIEPVDDTSFRCRVQRGAAHAANPSGDHS